MIKMSFYAFYSQAYAPSFKAIDLLLKTMDEPLSPHSAADALGMSADSVIKLMGKENIPAIDKIGFLTLMSLGESAVCRLYQREIQRGCKSTYSPADIAYIYGLDENHVTSVCDKLGEKHWPAPRVPELLNHIPIFIISNPA
jgi:hypothetical protein